MTLSECIDMCDMSSKHLKATFSVGFGLFFIAGRLISVALWIIVVKASAIPGTSHISQSQSQVLRCSVATFIS